MPLVAACATSSHNNSPWVVATKGERATVSLDTSRIEARAPGYRIHIQTQFAEPAWRPKPGGPAYDLMEATLDIDCDGRQARNVNAVVFDSLRHPVDRQTYQAQWQDFTQNDLGEVILTDLCRVLSHVRPIHDARVLTLA
jgi:surface-adhesin protein E